MDQHLGVSSKHKIFFFINFKEISLKLSILSTHFLVEYPTLKLDNKGPDTHQNSLTFFAFLSSGVQDKLSALFWKRQIFWGPLKGLLLVHRYNSFVDNSSSAFLVSRFHHV